MRHFFLIAFFGFIIISCTKENPNLIAKNKLGPLDSTTKIHQIEALMLNDSIVIESPEGDFGKFINSVKTLEVYNQTGEKQLAIEPYGAMDTISKIKSIRIFSNKYQTENGIGFGSTFGELKKHHDVTKIQSSLRSIIITLEDINAFVSFDREVLPDDVRFDVDAQIKPIMIPDEATINRFWLNFDTEDLESE